MKLNVGLIGVGFMGHGIATSIVRNGHALVVLEHAGNQPLDTLKAAGVSSCSSAKELAARSDVVILCVTGSEQVEAVVLGSGGVLEGLKPGGIILDCSTAVPESTRKIADRVQKEGGRFLDTPMTRGPKEAAEGRLNLLVGGDAELFETCKPLLACFSERATHVGPTGAGHAAKLLHNYVSLGGIALLSEAFACGRSLGVPFDRLLEVFANGGGGGVALERLRPYLSGRDSGVLQFAMSNACKDLDYYTDMADRAKAYGAIAEAVFKTYEAATEAGGAGAIVPDLVDLLGTEVMRPAREERP